MGKHEKIAARMAGKESTGEFHPCYVEYFRLFNAQEYYAAHDVLEHIWLGSDGECYVFYKALIQFAGGFVHLQHHHREPAHRIHGKRLRPAARLFRRSAELFAGIPPHYEGIVVSEIVTMALNAADKIALSAFAINPWHPGSAPQLPFPAVPRRKTES